MDQLQDKFAAEASKRRRTDGLAQFVTLRESSSDRLRSLAQDPWAHQHPSKVAEPPLENSASYKFLILGAGYGGLLFAVRLIQAGLADGPHDIRLIDTAGGFGGTWYWNRYPGVCCDVESYSYMPLLEETGYIPKHRYASGTELREHAERIADLWDLRNRTLLEAHVDTARWDDEERTWCIEVQQLGSQDGCARRQIRVQTRYFLVTGGIHTRPQVPKIPGLDSFAGPMCHSARWDYSITGGSPEKPDLTELRGKRVGVLGTGATAVQVVPHVAKWASKLYIFQRTPSSIHKLGQRPTDPEEWTTKVATRTDWQMNRMMRYNRFPSNGAQRGDEEDDTIKDSWSKMPAFSALIGGTAWGVVEPTGEAIAKHVHKLHLVDQPRLEATHSQVEDIVNDASTADKLKVCP